MIAERLLATLAARGLSVRRGAEPNQLILSGPDAEKTDDVKAAIREFKPELLEYLAVPPEEKPEPIPLAEGEHPPIVCGTCRAEFHAPESEVRAFLQSPAFCAKPKCRFR